MSATSLSLRRILGLAPLSRHTRMLSPSSSNHNSKSSIGSNTKKFPSNFTIDNDIDELAVESGADSHTITGYKSPSKQQQSLASTPKSSETEPEEGPFVNPVTGEVGGPRGPEPTRFGDWSQKGRVSDF